MKVIRNPVRALLVWIIRGYQKLISPALPRSCKYYPSCSQYAIDALRQYGVMRGVVLAGWRLLRCNPLSHGGYDPVERQTVFRERRSGASPSGLPRAGQRPLKGTSSLLVALLVGLLLVAALLTVSCSFTGETTTTAGVTTTLAGATTTVSDTTTTTVAQVQHPGSFDKISKPLQALFFWVLEFLHKTLGISWSWAIVLLTVIIRIVLVPLTWRQIKSMRAMQVLQPQLKALQEKYKDERAGSQPEDDGVLPGEQREPLRLLPPASSADAGLPRALLHAANGRETGSGPSRMGPVGRHLRRPPSRLAVDQGHHHVRLSG